MSDATVGDSLWNAKLNRNTSGRGCGYWTPLELPGVKMFCRGDYGIVLDGSNKVQQWTNAAIADWPLQQVTSSQRPVVDTLAGRPSIKNTKANNEWLTVDPNTTPGSGDRYPGAAELSYWVVGRFRTLNDNGMLFCIKGTGIEVRALSSGNNIFLGNNSPGSLTTTGGGYLNVTVALMILLDNAGSRAEAFKLSSGSWTSIAVNTGNAYGTTSTIGPAIGARPYTPGPLYADIDAAECGVARAVFTSGQQLLLAKYLNRRYGL